MPDLSIQSAAVVGTGQVAVTLAGASGDLVLTDAVAAATIKVSGLARRITGAAASGAVVTFDLDYECYANQPVTFSFNPLLGSIADGAGNLLGTTTDQAVTGGTDTTYYLLPQDANGWTDVASLPCVKKIYVSAAGNDANDGLTEGAAKLTVAGALAAVTASTAYQICLRRGDTFAESALTMKAGLNATSPAVLTCYGDPAAAMPILGLGDQTTTILTLASYNVVVSVTISGQTAQTGKTCMLVEDIASTGSRWFSTFIATGSTQKFTIRRSRFLQGGGCGASNNCLFLFEENVLAGNYIRAGSPLMRDNIVIGANFNATDGKANRNIFTQASGYTANSTNWYTAGTTNSWAVGNVVTGWKMNGGGGVAGHAIGNLLVNWATDSLPYGLACGSIRGYDSTSEVADNIIWHAPGLTVTTSYGVFRNNIIQSGVFGQQNFVLAGTSTTPAAIGPYLQHNRYWTDQPASTRWSFYTGDNATVALGSEAEWRARYPEDTSTFERVYFKNPRATIASYMGSIGKTATLAEYVAEQIVQGKDSWDTRLCAPAIRAYFLDAFTEVPASQEPYSDPLAGKTLLDNPGWQLPIDDEGWVDPPIDPLYTVLAYVASAPLGNDTNDGLSETTPKATIAEAVKLMRSYHPDRLRLRYGDKWQIATENFINAATGGVAGDLVSGRNTSWPVVVEPWGNPALGRPIVAIQGTVTGMSGGTRYVYRGIHLYSETRDPGSPSFVAANINTLNTGFLLNGYKNVWIEDCEVDHFGVGIEASVGNTNSVVRRNHVHHNWGDSALKSQGMHTSASDKLLIEENVFYHNGWNEDYLPAGAATVFDHNLYCSEDATNLIIRYNLFAKASSHGSQIRPGAVCHHNYYEDNAIHMLYGMVNGSPACPGGVSMDVHDCVFIGSKDINGAARGWVLEVSNLTRDEQHYFRNNVFANQRAGDTFPALIVQYGTPTDPTVATGVWHLHIQDNIGYNWKGFLQVVSGYLPGDPATDPTAPAADPAKYQYAFWDFTVTGNTFINLGGTTEPFVEHIPAMSQSTFAGNHYYDAAAPQTGWFSALGSTVAAADWITSYEADAATNAASLPQVTRNMGKYNLFLGNADDQANLVTRMAAQTMGAYDVRYTVPALLAWVKAGFVAAVSRTNLWRPRVLSGLRARRL